MYGVIMQYDSPEILIKGSGMVGLLAACALSKAGFEVSIPSIEENENDDGLRVSCITPVAVKIFQALGVWEKIQKHTISPFEKIKVWENDVREALLFEGSKIGQSPLGYVIENRVIRQVLINALDLSSGLRPSSSAREEGNLIIAADGANSPTREEAGIECETKDYQQQAIVAVIETSLPHNKIARQRFLSTGPLGFLPLNNPHRCSIVWSTCPNFAKELSSNSEIEFNSALQDAFGSELGEVRVMSKRLTFPLKMRQAKQYVKSGLALIGDAAHTIHPLAGYGVNMGFLDAVTLTHLLKKAKAEGRDIGGLHTLRKYERARKSENLLMLKICDSFTLPSLRHLGLNFTQRSQLLRNIFMKWMSHHGEENAVI
jgi:2-octaprenylphenol hydroxylase